MMTQLTATVLGFAFSLAVSGCDSPSAAASGEATPITASAALGASTSATATQVTKLVFVGKENACDCTRKRVEAGWAALQKALGTPAKVPVERLQIDTQGDKVEPYRAQKPIMVLPAIYFVDGKGTVLDLLQGEVTEAQVTETLANHPHL